MCDVQLLSLDDDDLFSSGTQTKVTPSTSSKPKKTATFSDDDDLFSSGSQTKVAPSTSSKPKKTATFSDDDDLFSSGSQTKVTPSTSSKAKKTADDDDLFSSGSQTKVAPSTSSKAKKTADDDDLFSSGSQTKVAPSTSSKAKKTADDDDLFSSGSQTKVAPSTSSKAKKTATLSDATPPDDDDDLFSDPLGGASLMSAPKTTPSSTMPKKADKPKARANGDDQLPPSAIKPKPKQAPPTAAKSAKQGAGLFEDSEEDGDIFSPPKSGADRSPDSDVDPGRVEPAAEPTRKKPVGGVSMFGGVNLFKDEKAKSGDQKGSTIAKKRDELFSKWVWLCHVIITMVM